MKKVLKGWKCQYIVGGQMIDFNAMRRAEKFSSYWLSNALSTSLDPLPNISSDEARQQYAKENQASVQAVRLIITITLHDYSTKDEDVATVDNLTYSNPEHNRLIEHHNRMNEQLRRGEGGNVAALLRIMNRCGTIRR